MNRFITLIFSLTTFSAIAASPPPANDDFANRISLVSAGSISTTTRNTKATLEVGEPVIAGVVGGHSIWWSWTAPFTGPVNITTKGSSFDTLLGVYIGTAVGALTTVVENDDYGTSYLAEVTFQATAGVPYAIKIDGERGAAGKAKLNINVTGSCTYTLSPSSTSYPSAGGSGTVGVTTQSTCTWGASSSAAWIVVTSGSSGTGNGTVAYSVAQNTGATSRTGTLSIAGQAVNITQAAPAVCSYSISPLSANYTDTGGSGTITVTTSTGCAWTAVSSAGFVVVTGGASGTGAGSVSYTVAANVTTATRSATITVAGQTFTVTQTAPIPCSYAINPTSASVGSSGGSGSIAVTTDTGCAWTATSQQPTWLTITSGSSGTGSGTVAWTASANTTTSIRTGQITAAGIAFNVTQAGVICSFSVSPLSASYTSSGGSGSVVVTANSACSWTSSSGAAWVTVTSGSTGSGNGTLAYTVAANTLTTSRNTILTVAGQSVQITQTGSPCTYVVSPTAAAFAYIAGSGSSTVTAPVGCAWTSISNVPWLTITSGSSSSGSDTVFYLVAANTSQATRTGQITAAGSVITITQTGDTTAPTVSVTAPTAGSTISNVVAVTATAADLSGIGRVDFYIDTSTLIGTSTISPYAISYNTTSIADGAHNFTAKATDAAGNQTTSAAVAVTISNAAPSTATWLKRLGSTGNDIARAVVTDSGNNVIVCGLFEGSVDFGGGALTSAGLTDMFVVKYSSVGAHIWSKRFGGTGADQFNAVAVTSADDVVLVGSFFATVNFGGGNFTSTFTGVGSATTADAVVLKLSGTDGSYVFANHPANNAQCRGWSVAVDASNNVYVTGSFQGSLDWNGTFATWLQSAGSFDIYAAKLNATTGLLIWDKRFGGIDSDEAFAVAVDQSTGDPVLGGYFRSTVDFGAGNVTSAGSDDMFLLKLVSATGAYSWGRNYGALDTDRIYGVRIDGANNVLASGPFMSTVNFSGTPVTSAGTFDVAIVKLNQAGTFQSVVRFGGISSDESRAIAIDSSNGTWTTGYFRLTAGFGTTTLTSAGLNDIYAVNYTSAAVFGSASGFGGTSDDVGNGIFVDSAGYKVVVGSFAGTATFAADSITSAGSNDIFVIRLAP